MSEWLSGITTWWGTISDTLTFGSLAEWVTAIIAVIAAIAAVRALRFNREANKHARDAARAAAQSNELTAQAYRDDVRVRDEAQARLVYATFSDGHLLTLEGGDVPKPYASSTPIVAIDGMVSKQPGVNSQAIVTKNAQIVRVTVHNRSSEIISSIRVSLFDRRSHTEVSPAHGRVVLLPEEIQDMEFIAPCEDARYEPDIVFRDATGKYWTRRGFDPIAPLPDKRRKELGLPKAS